jgi:hypothetical protein
MKTSYFKLESLILTAGVLLNSFHVNAQDNKPTREELKAAKRVQQYYNFQVVDSMIENKSFVLEADWLESQYGNRRPVSSGINFIMVDSSKAVLQTGSNGNMGYNGVGGVTAEGSLSGIRITKDVKNLSFFMKFTVTTNIGIYDISMTISSDKHARATITGLTPGKLIYEGRIVALYNSGVYKGRNSI